MSELKVTPVNKQRLYGEIISVLKKRDMTAREVSIELFKQGIVLSATRQETAPRLTELERKGIVGFSGTKIDRMTRKTVTIYTYLGAD